MNYRDKLNEHLQIIIGKQLDSLHLACEMMMFNFEGYALHAQCLTRIIYENNILVTTFDYQNWDGKIEENNDEWYFVEQYREKIIGGVVTSVSVTPIYDVVINLDNGVSIELFIKNGDHHFDDECRQWDFFKAGDHTFPFVTVYNKTVDIIENW